MSDDLTHFCRERLRALITIQDRQSELDREFERLEREIQQRLGIHPSVRTRIKPAAGRYLALYNRLGAMLDGSAERMDGPPREMY